MACEKTGKDFCVWIQYAPDGTPKGWWSCADCKRRRRARRKLKRKTPYVPYVSGEIIDETGFCDVLAWAIQQLSSMVRSELDLVNEGKIVLVRSRQTCSAAPSQWDCWDIDGKYWYLRFRSGYGTIGRTYDEEAASSFYDDGSPDINLEDMCAFLGVIWAPEEKRPGTIWEDPPQEVNLNQPHEPFYVDKRGDIAPLKYFPQEVRDWWERNKEEIENAKPYVDKRLEKTNDRADAAPAQGHEGNEERLHP